MKGKKRLFVDVALPVLLYSLILLISQLVVSIAFVVVFFATHTGVQVTDAAEEAIRFLNDKAMLIGLISYIVIVAVMFIDSRIRRVRLADYTRLSGKIGSRGVVDALLCGVSLSLYISLILSMLPLPEKWLSDYSQASSGLDEVSVLAILAVGIIGPLVEEMIFRGIIYKHFRICMSVYPAIIFQAVIFAILHGNTVIWVTYALFGGLLFGYIAMLSGNIKSSVLAHMAFNLVGYIIEPLSDRIVSVLIILSPIVLILSVWDIYKQSLLSN